MQRFDRRGANAIEFALLMPVFVAVMFGCYESCWLMYNRTVVASVLEQVCREGSLIDPGPAEADADDVFQHVQDEVPARIGMCATADCDIDAEFVLEPPSRSLRCTGTVTFPALIVSGGTMTVAAESTFRMEFQRYFE